MHPNVNTPTPYSLITVYTHSSRQTSGHTPLTLTLKAGGRRILILELSMVLKLMVCWVLTKNRRQLGELANEP